jgi:hypothetical protein
VLGGPTAPDVIPADTYRRLAADLRRAGRTVVADLSGEPLRAALEGGVTVLKVSHEELVADGLAESDSIDDLMAAMLASRRTGAGRVVVSRAGRPALATVGDAIIEVTAPEPLVLNLNVPDLPVAELRGVRRAALASFGAVQMTITEAGRGCVQVGVTAEEEAAAEPGTDAALIAAGYATVTALHPILRAGRRGPLRPPRVHHLNGRRPARPIAATPRPVRRRGRRGGRLTI